MDCFSKTCMYVYVGFGCEYVWTLLRIFWKRNGVWFASAMYDQWKCPIVCEAVRLALKWIGIEDRDPSFSTHRIDCLTIPGWKICGNLVLGMFSGSSVSKGSESLFWSHIFVCGGHFCCPDRHGATCRHLYEPTALIALHSELAAGCPCCFCSETASS